MAAPKLRRPTKDEEDKISDAIFYDDVDTLQNVLERGINVNLCFIPYDGCGTPLHLTVICKSTNCARLLISTFKADMNIADTQGQTPLQLAIKCNKNGMVYLLVEEYNQQLSHLSQEEKMKAHEMIEQYEKKHYESCIHMLMEDSLQKKSLANLRGRVSKGELVQMTKRNQWTVVYSDPHIFIDFQRNQAKIVKPKFVSYLLAIETLISRYTLFFNKQDSLIKCMLLNVGDKVDVILEQHVIPSAAIVRYKGELPRKRGIFFGVEILDEDKFGNTDGTFFQERIFSCPANKGLFVSIDKIQAKLSNSFLLEYAKQSACGLAPSRSFKITFVGPEGSGKSSSIRTLLGKKFNPNEVSTIGAVLGIQAMINWFVGNKTTEDKEKVFKLQSSHTVGWKEATVGDMQQLLDQEFIKEMSSVLTSTSIPESNSNLESETELLTLNLHSDEPGLKLRDTDDKDDKVNDDFEGKDSIQEETDSEQYSEAKSVMFGKKLDKLNSHACISDFAGQDTYFSFQLFFLKRRDTVIITFNASLDLTAKIVPRERYDHAKKKRLAAGMMTTIENIEFWLQSVSAHAGTSNVPVGCMSRRSPTAILCATHAEKLSTEKMVKISQFIFDYLADKPYVDHLPTDQNKAIIFISNKKRKKFMQNIVKLQEVLMEAATPAYSEERPISYLKLEQLIALKVEENIPMISIEEFTALVNKAGIPGESNSNAVSAALQYSSTRGTILYFSEVEILSKIVFISPHWLSSIFSKIITTHDQVVERHLRRAWTRYDTFAILEEHFLDHILKLASASEHKEIIISLMELFNLIAEIPNSTCFTDESVPPETDRRVYIVPSLLLYNPDLPVFIPEGADQVYLFYFSELYFPESVFNQIIVKMIRWNVQKQFQIDRIQHGLGQFNLDNLQSYCLIYEPNTFILKVCITQLDKTINQENKRKVFDSFIELMQCLEESIQSVIKLYLPCTKPPVLHVFCTECSDNSPHIMLKQVSKISLNLPNLYCNKTGKYLTLPRTSYLPFGDELDDEQLLVESNKISLSVTEMTESVVIQKFYKDLQSGFPLDEFLPQLVTKKIITLTDKLLITEYSKSVNERCRCFLDQCILKPISAGDPSAFYSLLQLMESSSQCIVLAARMKQHLMMGSLENKFGELSSSDTSVEQQLPQLDTLVTFYDKICKRLPVDELLPELVAQCVITKDNKTRIAVSGKTESDRTQYLLDHYIARPLLTGDPSFFNKLLDVMFSSLKCKYLINDIQHHLSTATNNQKFSGHQHKYTTTVIPGGKSRNDKPTIQELSQCVIHQYASQWKDLGAQLGLKDYEIANISSDYRNQCVEACREMLMLWLQNISSPTWGNLDDTIKSMKAILSSNPSGSSAPPTNVH